MTTSGHDEPQERQLRWSFSTLGPPSRRAAEPGSLQALLLPVLESLGQSGSPFQASMIGVPGDLGKRYTCSYIHGVGEEDNSRLPSGAWPDASMKTYGAQIPASDPVALSASAWLVFGASYHPAGVPGVPGAPVHGIWTYKEFRPLPADSLSPDAVDHARRVYMGVYGLLREADPDYFTAECRPLESHPKDARELPQEAMFWLSASLEFLGEILHNHRLPTAPYFAWVWASACRGPLREPVCELGSPAYRGPAAAAVVSD